MRFNVTRAVSTPFSEFESLDNGLLITSDNIIEIQYLNTNGLGTGGRTRSRDREDVNLGVNRSIKLVHASDRGRVRGSSGRSRAGSARCAGRSGISRVSIAAARLRRPAPPPASRMKRTPRASASRAASGGRSSRAPHTTCRRSASAAAAAAAQAAPARAAPTPSAAPRALALRARTCRRHRRARGRHSSSTPTGKDEHHVMYNNKTAPIIVTSSTSSHIVSLRHRERSLWQHR